METVTATPLPLPPPLAADLGKHVRREVTTGDSATRVVRFERPMSAPLYLKTGPIASPTNTRPLFEEAERLGWMHAVGLPVPAVLQYHEWKGHEYLLLTTLPGADASQEPVRTRHDATVNALAAGLRLLHATNISACPFVYPLRARMADADARLRAGAVDESDFDDERRGRTARDLHEQLRSRVPATEDRAFTHGDYCLPNVILEDDGSGGYRLSGFVDCGRAGVADPYQDLALAARSVAGNLGAEWVPVLFARYGLDRVDEERLRFYQLLDEFF